MQEAVTIAADKHQQLLDRVMQGKQKYNKLQTERERFDEELEKSTAKLSSELNSLSDNCLTDDWSPESCDLVLQKIKAKEQDLGKREVEMSKKALAQKQQYADLEETITLDKIEAIEQEQALAGMLSKDTMRIIWMIQFFITSSQLYIICIYDVFSS